MSRPNDPQSAIRDLTTKIEPELIEIRRDIHAHPELAFEEVRTAGVVARELEKLGIPHQTGIAKTGVVGLVRTLGEGDARQGAARVTFGFRSPSNIIHARDGFFYATVTAGWGASLLGQQAGACMLRTRDVVDPTSMERCGV